MSAGELVGPEHTVPAYSGSIGSIPDVRGTRHNGAQHDAAQRSIQQALTETWGVIRDCHLLLDQMQHGDAPPRTTEQEEPGVYRLAAVMQEEAESLRNRLAILRNMLGYLG